jgi:KDO2-lipid IV(A) lauroyltransferase
VTVEGWERVEAARGSGRPVIFLTGHCGNWELLAALGNCRGLGVAVLARELDDPAFQRLLVRIRERFGTRTIVRRAPGAARQLLGVLREGGSLGILIDQDTAVDGVWVPFLGRLAYTPVGPAQIALRLGALVLPSFIERLPDGSHLARFAAPLTLPGDPVAATAAMSAAIEEQVRRCPEQWVWMHRRWRRRPPEEGVRRPYPSPS